MIQLPPRYNPQETEDKWCQFWEESRAFHAEANPNKKPYIIVIPPPNVTGVLHMGHALNNTLQDIMIRYQRMKGLETLWLPGTDHAGIATQNVVEKELAKEGKTRQEIGREEFLKRLWEWKNQYGDTIIHQLKKLGASCDWERSRFTMDEHYSEVVKEVFIRLYQKGLIYRGEYIINWCLRCRTALSDEEAEHQEIQGALYHIRYPLKEDPKSYVVVATTRPETMLGDTAVAVHPQDRRYKKFLGKTLILPLIHREIKIISDSFVDSHFGSGAVKVTPAHDPNDFEMAKRHGLEFINIMHPDGRLNERAQAFVGLDRFEARRKIVEALKEQGLLEKIEDHRHSVGHCYRCETIVEPYLSKQWFVKMKPLAKPAIDVVKKGKIKFYPPRWNKVYLNWMENIRDWCISRQIWWGHRIPVWYCVGNGSCQLKCREPIVSLNPPPHCPHCGSTNITQDEDVLDTWFSSWLWPFAILYWPNNKRDLEYFYPTSSLFTAPEIIFFWVARMIMAGLEFMGEIPFSEVYIHGTVRDMSGRKMSKSLGNAIDPIDIIKEYGADALRFSLILNSSQDLFISKEKFEIGRNFANKIWNAGRLVLMNVKDGLNLGQLSYGHLDLQTRDLDLYSRWILSRLHTTLKKVGLAIERYRFSEGESLIYEFFWRNYCDWYLEIIKDRFSEPLTQKVSLYVLVQSLRMIHPFMPFVTEEIWNTMAQGRTPLARHSWPAFQRQWINKKAEQKMQTLIELISAIRNVRSHCHINPHEAIDIVFANPGDDRAGFIQSHEVILKRLARIRDLKVDPALTKLKESVGGIAGKIRFFIPLKGIIDIQKEKERISRQLKEQQTLLKNLSFRLKNKNFVQKAPPEIVEREKDRLKSLEIKVQEFHAILKGLQ